MSRKKTVQQPGYVVQVKQTPLTKTFETVEEASEYAAHCSGTPGVKFVKILHVKAE